MGDIEFQEIQDQLTPDQQVETDWVGGAFTLPRTTKRVLLVGASANYNNVVRQMHSVAQAVTDYGEGSPLAGMVQAFLKVPGAGKVPLYCLSIAAGTGTATKDVTLTTTATSAGVFRMWLAGRRFEVGVATGDTPTEIADAMVLEVDAKKYNLPVGITAALGVITVNAVTAGAAGNTVRVQTELTCGGTTSDTEDAPLASGTTDTDPATALAGVENERYHLIVIHSEDTTAQASLELHCTTMSQPVNKKACIGICASVGTGATAQGYADTEDSYRLQIVRLEQANEPVWEVAAWFAGQRAVRDPRQALADATAPGLTLPYDATKWPTESEIESDLTEGVVTLKCQRQGAKVMVTRSVVSRHGASLSGNEARDSMIIERSDYVDETVLQAFNPYKSRNLKTASPAGRPSTITPTRALGILARALKLLDVEDYVQGVQTDLDNEDVFAQTNSSNPDRLDFGFPFRPTRHMHFAAFKKTYVLANNDASLESGTF
jgi:phage tail sheath gpL-like